MDIEFALQEKLYHSFWELCNYHKQNILLDTLMEHNQPKEASRNPEQKVAALNWT